DRVHQAAQPMLLGEDERGCAERVFHRSLSSTGPGQGEGQATPAVVGRSAGDAEAVASGSEIVNSVCPGRLCTPTEPWWASTTAATIARPSPVLRPDSAPGVRTRLTSA